MQFWLLVTKRMDIIASLNDTMKLGKLAFNESCNDQSRLLPQNSCIEKAFLFDVLSKIYIATDSSPVDMSTYELCCDMIDVVIDISCIYG